MICMICLSFFQQILMFIFVAYFLDLLLSNNYLLKNKYLLKYCPTNNIKMRKIQDYKAIVCICGNDGTGKSTITRLINEKNVDILALQRSSFRSQSPESMPKHPQVNRLVNEIKLIDKLTYRYSFEDQRQKHQLIDFIQIGQSEQKSVLHRIKVYWIMLEAQIEQIFKRVQQRDELSIYESQKCIKYFDQIYRQMAFYWGIPIVRNDGIQSPQEIEHRITRLIFNSNQQIEYKAIRGLRMQSLSYQKIQSLDVESILFENLSDQLAWKIYQNNVKQFMKSKQPELYGFYFPELEQVQKNIDLFKKLACRWIARNGTFSKDFRYIKFKDSTDEPDKQIIISLVKSGEDKQIQNILLYRSVEGQSKIIYRILCDKQKFPILHLQYFDKILILLKSTIYSHKMQHTGQINNLAQIRAQGSALFLEMMRRNQLKHAYICLNKLGIILSKRIDNINKLEIVFKKYCIGTDKHSYHGISNPTLGQLISIPKVESSEGNTQNMKQNTILNSKSTQYESYVYIRYDWRNPNHFLNKQPRLTLNCDPYYYIVQSFFKKESFFKTFLANSEKCKPMGDKCITKDILQSYVNQDIIDRTILKLYCTMAYYLDKVGLELIDGCSMIQDKQGIVWSQINPDCMRVKKKQGSNSNDYDKDIWRKGGSSAKQHIIQKWTLFNQMLRQYFLENRFHQGQLWEIGKYPYQITAAIIQSEKPINPYSKILNQFIRGNKKRQIIATIDLRKGLPTLVKSSQIAESHSNDVEICYQYLSVFNKVVMVNLDAALQSPDSSTNFNIIKSFAQRKNSNLYGAGGGIRTKEIVQFYKQNGIQNMIISTNLDLIDQVKESKHGKSSPIVELSVNEDNQVLTHGRTINTHINVIAKIIQLVQQKDIKIVSITFVKSEGHLSGLPRKQIKQLMVCIPGKIQTVIIAGGITTVEDLQFLWGFDKCVPQLGAAIWKKTIKPQQILSRVIKWKNTTKQGILICPAIIYDVKTEEVLGEVYMNRQALQRSVQSRVLWRYSRHHSKLIKKGQQSGNVMKIKWLRVDCDQDCILIGVQSERNQTQFCHQKQKSCFQLKDRKQKLHTFQSLQKHIESRKQAGGYSSKMQNNSGLSYLKLLQQVQQMQLAQKKQYVVSQCADAIAHLLMYMNSRNIETKQVFEQLTKRSLKQSSSSIESIIQIPQVIQTKSSASQPKFLIGIVSGKHYNFCDIFCEKLLGVKIIRSSKQTKQRSLDVQHQIVQKSKLEEYIDQRALQKLKFLGMKSKDMPLAMSKGIIQYCINYSIMMQNWPTVSRCIVQQDPSKQIRLALIKRAGQKIDAKSWTSKKKGMIASQYPVSVTKYFTQKLGIQEDCFTIFKVSGCSQSYLRINKFDYCDAIVVTGKTLEQNNLQIQQILSNQVRVGLYEII